MRKHDPNKVAKEEILHELTKQKRDIGDVDAGDVSALSSIIRKQAKYKGKRLTTKEVIETQGAAMSEMGADPTMALKQVKAKQEHEKKLNRWLNKQRNRKR